MVPKSDQQLCEGTLRRRTGRNQCFGRVKVDVYVSADYTGVYDGLLMTCHIGSTSQLNVYLGMYLQGKYISFSGYGEQIEI